MQNKKVVKKRRVVMMTMTKSPQYSRLSIKKNLHRLPTKNQLQQQQLSPAMIQIATTKTKRLKRNRFKRNHHHRRVTTIHSEMEMEMEASVRLMQKITVHHKINSKKVTMAIGVQ